MRNISDKSSTLCGFDYGGNFRHCKSNFHVRVRVAGCRSIPGRRVSVAEDEAVRRAPVPASESAAVDRATAVMPPRWQRPAQVPAPSCEHDVLSVGGRSRNTYSEAKTKPKKMSSIESASPIQSTAFIIRTKCFSGFHSSIDKQYQGSTMTNKWIFQHCVESICTLWPQSAVQSPVH